MSDEFFGTRTFFGAAENDTFGREQLWADNRFDSAPDALVQHNDDVDAKQRQAKAEQDQVDAVESARQAVAELHQHNQKLDNLARHSD